VLHEKVRGMRVPLVAVIVLLVAATPASAALNARGSARQVQVTGAKPGERLQLVDRRGRIVAARRARALGGVVFRNVAPGRGYRVRARRGERSDRFSVMSNRAAPPRRAIYDQQLPAPGYGYVRTRDGTRLAINVQLPGPVGEGPYPTLVEYSGYGYANPAGGESSIAAIAGLLGYAVVDVNMRGTGCSGGAFDYFERLQALDGYDVVETVARQPWALHHEVGMFGVSYGGISQLFVASTRPPSLAAIAPMSVIDNTQTTLYQGGLLNTGFAFSWAQDRVHDARPASRSGGQEWALDRIAAGDRVCKANQALHADAVDLIAKIRANNHYRPRVADPLAPITFVDRIEAPTFLACQFTDEQTGGHCPALARHFTGTDRKWFTFTNGTHVDALDPATFMRWFDFLELYVARRKPQLPDGVRLFAPALYETAMGIPGIGLPADDPIASEPTFQAARAAFERQPEVTVQLDNGAGGALPGQPLAAASLGFPSFPAPGTNARRWFFDADGRLAPRRPADAAADRFTWDPRSRPATSFSGDTGTGPGGLWTATPTYRWAQSPPGRAVSYVTDALAQPALVLGAGRVDAYIRSRSRDVDLQATISEVRPDGAETFVQSGWLRASARKLDAARSRPLEPVPSLRRRDARRLPRGRYARVTVPLYYQGHLYRAGSRIRVTIAAPGGDQPVWEFGRLSAKPGTSVTVGRGGRAASALTLPVVTTALPATPLPPCPSLRGQPCRPYVAFANIPTV
jgi:predicted acyl esterase